RSGRCRRLRRSSFANLPVRSPQAVVTCCVCDSLRLPEAPRLDAKRNGAARPAGRQLNDGIDIDGGRRPGCVPFPVQGGTEAARITATAPLAEETEARPSRAAKHLCRVPRRGG